jgi:hypothetical protein
MTTAAQRLAELGTDIPTVQAGLQAAIDAHTDPALILAALQQYGITNEMLGEIAAYPGPPYTPQQVRDAFAQYGIDSSVLDPAPIVTSVSSVTVEEGGALQHTVTLSGATTAATEYNLSIELNTVSVSDFSGYSLSNGVQLASFTSLVVPAGVSSFTFTLNSANDSADESNESYTVRIGGVAATGTIGDNDNPAPPVDVTVQSVGAASALEGADLVHTVTLSAVTQEETNFLFSIGGGTVAEADLGGVSFSSGVTMDGDHLVVPAGVSSFNLVQATVDDDADEPQETLQVTIGGVMGFGTIGDNDEPPPVAVTVESVASVVVDEGSDLHHTVTFTGVTEGVSVFQYSIGGGTIALDDIASLSFSNGVTSNGSELTVPEGLSSFDVILHTANDTTDEDDETVQVTVGGVSGTGTVQDNDAPPPPPPPPPPGSSLLPTAIDGFAPVLDLNDRSGGLSTLTIRTAVLNAIADDSKYWSLFDPAKYEGSGDGFFSPEELGVSHLGTLPATAETIESLYYGTFFDVSTTIDYTEAGAIGLYFATNFTGIFTHNPAILALYVNLFVDAAQDPAALQAHPDAALANTMPTGMIAATTNAGLQENIFWGLLNI